MSSRKLAALVAAALSLTMSAYAEDVQKGVSVNGQFAGSIIATVSSSPVAHASEQAGPGYAMVGNCNFVGVLTPNNRLQVAFGGHAEAVGPQSTQLTYVKCSVSNQDAQSDSSEFANGGPMSQTAKTTSPWRVSPITVCVEGFAVLGPTPVTIITMAKRCNTISGLGGPPPAGVTATGSGTNSPGLTTTPTFQTMQMDFTAYGGVNNASAASGSGCRYVATSVVPETIAAGAGSGTLGNCPLTGTLNYVRTANYMQVSGHINGFGDGARTHVFGHCTIVYTTYAPGQTWIWICSIFGIG